jgi:hypothetical protein
VPQGPTYQLTDITVFKITFKSNTKQNDPLWAMQFIPHPLHT